MCGGRANSERRRKVTSEPDNGCKMNGPGGKGMPPCCNEMMAKMMDSYGSQSPAGEMMAEMMKGCCDERTQDKSEAREQETSPGKE